jgi:hypothetical protein
MHTHPPAPAYVSFFKEPANTASKKSVESHQMQTYTHCQHTSVTDLGVSAVSASSAARPNTSLNASLTEGTGDKNWRQWLAVVSEGDAMGPLWVRVPAPDLKDREEIDVGTAEKETYVKDEMLADGHNSLAVEHDDSFGVGVSMVAFSASNISNGKLAVTSKGTVPADDSFLAELDQLAEEEGLCGQTDSLLEPDTAQDEGPAMSAATVLARLSDDPAEALCSVEHAIMRMCGHAWAIPVAEGNASHNVNAVSVAGEAYKLLSEEVFPNCRGIRRQVRVYALSTVASMLYMHAKDYDSAYVNAERALTVCVEHGFEAKFELAVCRLQIAACATKLGMYTRAFKVRLDRFTQYTHYLGAYVHVCACMCAVMHLKMLNGMHDAYVTGRNTLSHARSLANTTGCQGGAQVRRAA